MVILIVSIISLCALLEFLTLKEAFTEILGNANFIMVKNYKLISLYVIVSILLFPVTLISTIIPNCRAMWFDILCNSIQRNFKWFFI